MKFEQLSLDQVDWPLLDTFEDRNCCQRQGWLEFIRDTQAGEPVVARLDDRGTTLGYFTGVIVRKFGIAIMGSPFPGWTTPFMGFNLQPGVPRREVVAALLPFVIRELGCWHLELIDPRLSREDVDGLGFDVRTSMIFVSDLSLTENELLALMDSEHRRLIRRSAKTGLIVEEAEPEGFADECYTHVEDVFRKQGLKPNYDRERIAKLIQHVYPSGDLLLLRVRDPEGNSIASLISVGFNDICFFWGGGSLRQYQSLRPNEALHWYAMRCWKARGVSTLRWGGVEGFSYKKRYGPQRVETLHFLLSRYPIIGKARDVARAMHYLPRSLKPARFRAHT